MSVSVIVPTLRERDNIPLLLERLRRALAGLDWEVIFVDDDSDDGTADLLIDLATKHPDVRFLRRIGRCGLASACLEGMAASSADLFAVMDADLQHDERILPNMMSAFSDDPALELAVGTRYATEDGMGNWSPDRQFLSRVATALEKSLLHTSLTDPMSGFFVVRRSLFEENVRRMTGKGFKILLDFVLTARRPIKTREFPYQFQARQHGTSKLDVIVGLEYLYLLLDKTLGRLIPVRFVLYVIAGLTGLFLHLALLATLHRGLGLPFLLAQTIATLLAMVSNFFVNNSVTFRSTRLRGPRLAVGLAAYIAVCAIGAIVNIQTASYLFDASIPWWLAGTTGALIGAVWNYAVSAHIVWTWLPTLWQRARA